ncbi:MAG: uracil-DNA glycosylase [Desulfobulbaceae bacterium]|jgi:DNA polymerase|nr:uracil-DNA glycosylase [Desulfobulbaceae bacterium]
MTPLETQYFLQSARSLMRYHQALGIDRYPVAARLSFLDTAKPSAAAPDISRPPAVKQAPPPQTPAAPRRAESVIATPATVAPSELQNCRLCQGDAIQPRTARAGHLGRLEETGKPPKLFVIGDYRHDTDADGPFIFGREEDDLLQKMLAAITIDMADAAITNIVKCLPTDAHNEPDDACARHCLAHLRRQLLATRPRLILALGATPARILVGRKASLSALRSRLHNFFVTEDLPIPVLVSYHPGFLLTQTEMKKAAWEDLKMARRFLDSLPLTVRAIHQ